jgi:hypothetical protein
MAGEWQDKAENPVECGRPSLTTLGGFKPIPVLRVRQPHEAKEPLCGNQPANLSLVIVVLRFPSCLVILPFWFWHKKEIIYRKKYF